MATAYREEAKKYVARWPGDPRGPDARVYLEDPFYRGMRGGEDLPNGVGIHDDSMAWKTSVDASGKNSNRSGMLMVLACPGFYGRISGFMEVHPLIGEAASPGQ